MTDEVDEMSAGSRGSVANRTYRKTTGKRWSTNMSGEWISVKERLPEIGQIVVVFKRTPWGTFRGAGKYCKNLHGIPSVDVTGGFRVFSHWMPFPDAPGDDK